MSQLNICKQFFRRFILLLFIIAVTNSCDSENRKSQIVIIEPTPTPFDVTIFFKIEKDRRKDEEFLIDHVDQLATHYSFRSLRKKNLPADTTELRIWVGFSSGLTRGLILSEKSAKYLPPSTDESGRERNEPVRDLVPTEGWEKFWKEVESIGLLHFPEEPVDERIEPANDSDVVMVEVKKGINYRSIMYGFPCNSKGLQAKLLIDAIIKTSKNLGIDFYKCGEHFTDL